MLHSGNKVSEIELKMDKIVRNCLKARHHFIKATSLSGTKDYLEKIVQIVRGCGFGIAIFSEFTPAPTLANIFFEIGLCSLLGKPVILVKSAKSKPPSDFVRTEWVTYQGGDTKKLKRDLSDSIKEVSKLAKYYEDLGDLAMDADDVDVELAFERYKQAVLIADSKSARKKIGKILNRLHSNQGTADLLRASKVRLRKSISEFIKLLH
ncbi:MAG: hypothetical protein WBP93_06355 [Pyrinomonadaceae bacterium]